MKSKTILIVASVTLTAVALGVTFGRGALNAQEKRKPWPKATPPPPPSSIYIPVKEDVPTEEQIAAAAETHNRDVATQIERSLSSQDRHQREAAFTYLIPELLQLEPKLLLEMLERQKPGEARDELRTEIARQWISTDRDATIAWMKSLESAERQAAAYVAVKAIAAAAPEQALYVADQFGLGREDGYVETLVRGWAVDEPEAAARWLAAEPDGPRKRQLAAQIERARRTDGARD
jgi:hypothetical protein